MTISRGYAAVDRTPVAAPRPRAEPNPQPTLEYCLINDRLAALERLLALRDKGILTDEEIEYEKAAILRLPNEELILRPGPAKAERGPSLLGRLFDWRVLASGIVAGLALAAFTRPGELTRLLSLVTA